MRAWQVHLLGPSLSLFSARSLFSEALALAPPPTHLQPPLRPAAVLHHQQPGQQAAPAGSDRQRRIGHERYAWQRRQLQHRARPVGRHGGVGHGLERHPAGASTGPWELWVCVPGACCIRALFACHYRFRLCVVHHLETARRPKALPPASTSLASHPAQAHWKHTPVAVKILISGEGALEQSTLELPAPVQATLQAEAGVMCMLRHPNICAFYGVCSLPPCLVTGALHCGVGRWRLSAAAALSPADEHPAAAHALPTHAPTLPTEYCSRGSLYDVLRTAARQPDKAAELTWRLRLGMVSLADVARMVAQLQCAGIAGTDRKCRRCPQLAGAGRGARPALPAHP